LRIGILTIKEKWEQHLTAQGSYITQDFLSEKFPIQIEDDNLIINSTVLPTDKLVKLIKQLGPNESILDGEELIAARLTREQFESLIDDTGVTELEGIDVSKEIGLLRKVGRPYDLFAMNDVELASDFDLLTKGRQSQPISDTNTVIAPGQIFLEEGATVECAILNAIGEWCNLGADTNTSNLKNNYDEVKLWSYEDQRFAKTDIRATMYHRIHGEVHTASRPTWSINLSKRQRK